MKEEKNEHRYRTAKKRIEENFFDSKFKSSYKRLQ